MNIEEDLEKIGINTFISHYYDFKELPSCECMEKLGDEIFSEKSKMNRISVAKMLFRKNRQFQALEYIAFSDIVDDKIRYRARAIREEEEWGVEDAELIKEEKMLSLFLQLTQRQKEIVLDVANEYAKNNNVGIVKDEQS